MKCLSKSSVFHFFSAYHFALWTIVLGTICGDKWMDETTHWAAMKSVLAGMCVLFTIHRLFRARRDDQRFLEETEERLHTCIQRLRQIGDQADANLLNTVTSTMIDVTVRDLCKIADRLPVKERE